MFGKERHPDVRGKLSDFYEAVRLADFVALLPSPLHVIFLVVTNDFRARAADHAQRGMQIHLMKPIGFHLSFFHVSGRNIPAAVERRRDDGIVADGCRVLVNRILLLESSVSLLHLHGKIK